MAISKEQIFAVADELDAAGQNPTLANVRKQLGSGSFTTISEAMKGWKAAQAAAAAPLREAAPAAVTERMGELAGEIWGVALGMANDRLAKEREALESTRQEVEAQRREAAELADQMSAELETARAQIEQQAHALKLSEVQAVQLIAAQEAAHTAQAALAEAQKRADGLAALLEQERAATREAQAKAEKALTDAAKLEGKLVPVVKLVTVPSVYMVHPSMGVKDFQGFMAKVKAKPGDYSVGVPGLGTLGHLMMASFNETLKTDIQIVPYRGNGPALNDALAGMVQVMADQLPSAMPHIKGGKLVPMALAADRRVSELPDVPTFKELGHADLNELGMSWFGLVVPAGTPAPIIKRLQDAAVSALRSPDVQGRLKTLGATAVEMDQSKFASQIAADLQRNKALLDKLGVKPE